MESARFRSPFALSALLLLLVRQCLCQDYMLRSSWPPSLPGWVNQTAQRQLRTDGTRYISFGIEAAQHSGFKFAYYILNEQEANLKYSFAIAQGLIDAPQEDTKVFYTFEGQQTLSSSSQGFFNISREFNEMTLILWLQEGTGTLEVRIEALFFPACEGEHTYWNHKKNGCLNVAAQGGLTPAQLKGIIVSAVLFGLGLPAAFWVWRRFVAKQRREGYRSYKDGVGLPDFPVLRPSTIRAASAAALGSSSDPSHTQSSGRRLPGLGGAATTTSRSRKSSPPPGGRDSVGGAAPRQASGSGGGPRAFPASPPSPPLPNTRDANANTIQVYIPVRPTHQLSGAFSGEFGGAGGGGSWDLQPGYHGGPGGSPHVLSQRESMNGSVGTSGPGGGGGGGGGGGYATDTPVPAGSLLRARASGLGSGSGSGGLSVGVGGLGGLGPGTLASVQQYSPVPYAPVQPGYAGAGAAVNRGRATAAPVLETTSLLRGNG